VGGRIATLQDQGITFGPDVRWRWHRDGKGRTVAYVTLDASGTRQQGPGARRAEGRMAYVGGVSNPPPPQWLRPCGPAPPVQARSVSGLDALAAMGPLWRYQATAVGMERADIWIALSDGGNGLASLLQSHFNRVDRVVILDFYHAASYVEALAQALHPGDEAQAAGQAEQWGRLLKEEGGVTTLAFLREWDWPTRKSPRWRAAWQALESDLVNNLHWMAYPEYVAEGWQIGSGVVESACKTVVGQRRKGAGKGWGEAGGHALCHARALYRSEKGQWEAFWRRQYTQRANVQQLK
jgi:hypothetical protein